MTQSTLLYKADEVAHPWRSAIDRWARTLLRRGLAQLGGGQIEMEDEWGAYTLGKGPGLEARVRVVRSRFYRRLVSGGSLAAAEAYMDGDWTTDDLTTVLRIFARDLSGCGRMDGGWTRFRSLGDRLRHALRDNTRGGSRRNVRAHYDLGNDFFALFLDETMNYSAGIFEHSGQSMAEASGLKMDRACRKLALGPTDHLLEIGTGWGAMAIHAASRYGCRVTTTTISDQQYRAARERIRAAGLESRIDVLRQDYRALSGSYDKLVSIEMIEGVGHRHLETYFLRCMELLRPEGLMLLQAIVTPDHRYAESRNSVDFIRRYVFPGSCLTSVGRISEAIGRVTDFRTLHVEDIGPSYAETLRRWRDKFRSNIPQIRQLGYDERFLRMWDYYLSYCEAGFEERIVGDVQMLLARPSNRRRPVLGSLEYQLPAEAAR